MAAAIPIMMIAAAAVSAYSAVQQGKAAKAASAFNATIATQNAEISRDNAEAQATQQDRENLLRLGAIRAAQGKSGGTASGSVLDVLADTAAQGELERQNIVYQGELRARGFANTATLDEFGGKNAEKAGYLKAGSELLSGAGKAYSAYGSMTRT